MGGISERKCTSPEQQNLGIGNHKSTKLEGSDPHCYFITVTYWADTAKLSAVFFFLENY